MADGIQATDRAYRRLRDRYRFERRGPVQVKGKGELVTGSWSAGAVSRAEPRDGRSP